MADTITDHKLSKRVRLTVACVYMNSYFKMDDQGIIAKARDELDKHNIQLDLFPTNMTKTSWNTMADYDSFYEVPDETEAYKAVWTKAKEKLKQMGCTHVAPQVVVFGQYKSRGWGISPLIIDKGTTRLCMISPVVNKDQMTLLHELGHGAGLNHDTTGGEPRNFMHTTDEDKIFRTVMYKYQVEAMAKATFAVGS